MFSTCPFVYMSVHPFVCYQTCEQDVLKTNEGILMPIGTSGPRGKGMKRSTLGIRGQRSGSYEVEIDKFPFG